MFLVILLSYSLGQSWVGSPVLLTSSLIVRYAGETSLSRSAPVEPVCPLGVQGAWPTSDECSFLHTKIASFRTNTDTCFSDRLTIC